MAVKPIPEGYHALNPSLAVDDARKAIDFYKRALGAGERMVMPGPGGTVAHAELEVGDSVVMLADTTPQSLAKPPSALGGTSVVLFLYVDDVDAVVQQACDAGATLTMPVTDMFWGDRSGQITDPFGHQWWIATHIEDVPPAEMAERAKRAMAAMGGG
jgi:PhnB protein